MNAESALVCLDGATKALTEVDAGVGELCDPVDLAHVLVELRNVKRRAGAVYDAVEQALAGLLPDGPSEIPGVGVVERKRKGSRTQWKWDDLLSAVVARGRDERLVDADTGEALESEVDAVVRAITECVGFRAGKVTGMRARGLQPDEFCSESWEDRWSVLLPREDEW